jgi:predicted nucleic acid-binding protein
MVLECCLSARAHYLVTGDRDLLDLSDEDLATAALQTLRIVTPRQYASLRQRE